MVKKLKIISVTAALCAVLASVCFALGCAKLGKDKTTIVCLGYAQYDWTMQILGDQKGRFEVKYLLDSGVDLHSYQASASDITIIKTADLLIYTGGESEEWVEKTLDGANENLKAVSLLEILSDPLEEEWIEGMQPEDEEEEEETEGEEETEYDEHVWLSIKNAKIFVTAITEKICEIDDANKDEYIANANSYKDKLTALDNKYSEAVAAKTTDTILFADRFPFLYLAKDYGINYYSAFHGCSTEVNASFDTIRFLVQKVNDLNLAVILTLENTQCGAIAQTVKDNSNAKNQRILTMNSLQSVTKQNMQDGLSYLSVMEANLETLKIALGVA
jgi:zinc transport system substrate-binding protein